MILIISNSSHESTTDYVIDWLISSSTPFIRLNSEDVIEKKIATKICVHSNSITIANQTINLDDINVVWYRRWYNYDNVTISPKNGHERKLLQELYNEADAILNYLGFALEKSKWLNHPFSNQLHNKLNALRQAHLLGISIPDTLLTNKKEVLVDFYKKNKNKIITKPIGDPRAFFDKEMNVYKAYTEPLTKEFIDGLNDDFFVSLFQSTIKAEYEVRTFYLDGEFFSTAILNSSETDIKLSVRRDEKIKMISYNLPIDLKSKLDKLMKKLDLNSGSIDMLKTEEGEFFFIEVNPVGQFLGYGTQNNYKLEKKVSDWLIKNS